METSIKLLSTIALRNYRLHPNLGLLSTLLNPRGLKTTSYQSFHRLGAQYEQNKISVKKSLDTTSSLEHEEVVESCPESKSKGVVVAKKKLKVVLSPEEEKDTLPDHDPQRITPESRRYSRKASAMFEELVRQRGATKETFILATKKYIEKETLYRRGALEFIYAGLHEMKRFGLVRDLDCYKALIQAFPEGRMIPKNFWQVELKHFARQQDCGIDLLEQMERNVVFPDRELGVLLKNRFGSETHVTSKYKRMMYWLSKFKHQNPYPIPFEMPDDEIERALIALKRMSVDRETVYKVWKTSDMMENSDEDTFIASAQSPTQQRLLQEHDTDSPLFVEGPFNVVSRIVIQKYFLLRAEPNVNALMKKKQLEKEEEADENLFEWKNFFDEEHFSELVPVMSVHEQDDSTILGLCITGTSSKSSVVNWIRCLELVNPKLGKTPILFQLTASLDSDAQSIGDNRRLKDPEIS